METNRFNTLATRLLLLLALVSFVSSCKKDDEISPKKKKDLLIKTWTVYEITVDNKKASSEDFDNAEFAFKKDGSYTFESKTQDVSGDWELNDDADELTLDGDTGFDVVQLDKSELHLGFTIDNPSNTKTGKSKIVLKMK